MIVDPVTIEPERRISEALEVMSRYRISGIPVTNNGKLVGILTNRDLRFETRYDLPISEVMTKEDLITVPVGLFLLAVVGMLWSPAPWGERLYAVGPTLKLLMLPFLFYHFERSARGRWVFVAFLVSCVLLSVVSWIVAFYPNLSLKPAAYAERGIFVKDYIDQSQEFALCAVALAYPVITLLRERRIGLAILLAVVAASFVTNMAFGAAGTRTLFITGAFDQWKPPFPGKVFRVTP